ncbi:hypothetical protein [Brasilonema bromeliae]|uniref:Uncharacterized protein n=1 Tax=Brasilonema bromeliae SPC951 TaxID=385972 RepID=A0ABX1P8G8_9CYAN|nr:hypothetical protein [Brasilonema bromeliae]NMG20715.1 hypothetical protein [Brasilonema bromeliae SPC951]
MTQDQPSRLDRIEAILADIATQQAGNTQAIAQLAENTDRVLARSAILDDVLLELRENSEQHQREFEQHQRNFEEHQRTTNAALQSLEAILLQLIRRGS